MLNSIEITNYKSLKNLKLDSLKRINLITGKNNTGKSSVLEAIAIYLNKGSIDFLIQLLEKRGELLVSDEKRSDILERNIQALSSLFYQRVSSSVIISIAAKQGSGNPMESVNFQITESAVSSSDKNNNSLVTITSFDVFVPPVSSVNLPIHESMYKYRHYSPKSENMQFVEPIYNPESKNSKYFDSIALTSKEKYVIEALKIIEPSTERIAFIDNAAGKRSAVIKLNDQEDILPIQSMGDGINRILSIILALVNCENGYLLIDEFENGLYYSVQDKLWKIIFELSKKLNIQVFATTYDQRFFV